MNATARQSRETADYSLSLAVKHSVSSPGDSFRRKIINSIRASASSEARAVLKVGLAIYSRIFGKRNLISHEIRASPPETPINPPRALTLRACPHRSGKRGREMSREIISNPHYRESNSDAGALLIAEPIAGGAVIPEITFLDSGSA
jgi:hypothetical protein